MTRGAATRYVIRGVRRRLETLSKLRRPAFALCAALVGWSWWAAQTSGYAGLPVSVLGQITGDLILMGLLAPTVRLAACGRVEEMERLLDELGPAPGFRSRRRPPAPPRWGDPGIHGPEEPRTLDRGEERRR